MPWTNYLSLDNFLFWFRTWSHSCHKLSRQNSQKPKKNNYSTWRTTVSAFIHYSLLSECFKCWEESSPRHNTVVSIHKTLKSINRLNCHSVFTNLPFHFLLSTQSDIQAKTMVFKPRTSCSVFVSTAVPCRATRENEERGKISNTDSVSTTNVDISFIIDFFALI